MYATLGILVVFCSVIGGYLLEEGNIHVLFQPIELLIIIGAALGSLLLSSPPKVIKLIITNINKIFFAEQVGTKQYLELLSLLYEMLNKIRREGLISVEPDVEEPESSPLFQKYKVILKNKKILDFICDNIKVIISTNIISHELDNLLDIEIEKNYQEAMIPSLSIAKVADSLPGLGIVAAVLGIVITMGKIHEPPAILGHSIGAAMVGTFLGVLLSYGFVGPMASNLEHQVNEKSVLFEVIKIALVSFTGGAAPQIAVEFGRRAIPGNERPSFSELEQILRQ